MLTGDPTISPHVDSVMFHLQVIIKIKKLDKFDSLICIWFIPVKNPSRGQKSTQDYLSLLDKKTLSDLIEMYKPDFEMFQYTPEVI